MNVKKLLVPAICLLALSAGAQSVAFLETVPDARGASLGGLGVATSADAWSVYWNAAKAVTAKPQVALDYSFSPWLKDYVDNSRIHRVAGYYRLSDKDAVVAGFRHFANGEFDLYTENGQAMGTVNPKEYALEAGYARMLAKGLSAGATVRYIRSDLGALQGADPANAVAFDLSLYYRMEVKLLAEKSALSFGLQVADLGSRIKYDLSEYSLPGRLTAGAALELPLAKHHLLTGAADMNYRLLPSESRSVSGGVGLEYAYRDWVYVRGGYHWGDIEKTCGDYVGVGAGVHYKYGTVGFAYRLAMEDYDPLDKTMTFTVGFNF